MSKLRLTKLWEKTKETAVLYTKIFVVVMLLNQLLFFGLCLNPVCLAAATPHVLVITVIVGILWNSSNDAEKVAPTSPEIRALIERELSGPRQNQVVAINDGNLSVLKGSDHYRYLIESLDQSTDKLIIMSGWLSKHVINDALLKKIAAKLRQGIKIYIGYGWQDSQGKHQEFEGSKKISASLNELMEKYPNSFFLACFATHEKLLIVDDQTVVIGSANWLSNRQYKNSERSVIIEDQKFALSEAERAITVIRQNRSPF